MLTTTLQVPWTKSGPALSSAWVPEGHELLYMVYNTALAGALLTAMVPLGQPMQWGSLMRSQAKMVGSSTSAKEKEREISAALRLVAFSKWHPSGTIDCTKLLHSSYVWQASHAQHEVMPVHR